MVSEAPRNHDLFEVDEPTQPFSRGEIDRLRRIAALEPAPAQAQEPDAEIPDLTEVSTPSPLAVVLGAGQAAEEWFELEGRWLRVSLESFAHFGMSGTPPGMLGSEFACFVSGTIGDPRESSPIHRMPRLTEVYEAASPEPDPEPEPEELQFSSPSRKRSLWAVLIASPLGLALVAWIFAHGGDGPEQPMSQDVAPPVVVPVANQGTAEPTAPVAAPIVDEPESSGDGETGGEVVPIVDKKPGKRKAPKGLAQSPACVEHRKTAQRALDDGKWELLLDLTQNRSCWARASEAKALKMRALFELEQFQECVRLGTQGGSKEIQKWLSNCQRALE
jgi:hypothetical protein